MIVSYTLRLVCLCLAVFMVTHVAVGAAVALFASSAIAAAERMRPRNGARLLFALRLLPAASALFVVAVICVPGYLWLESEAGPEELGWRCLTAAGLAAVVCAMSLSNGIRSVFRSTRFARHCERSGAPVMMLAGVFRPRLVVSRVVREALDGEQYDAAVRHEEAHLRSRDNLKRLLLAATPALGLRALERAWLRMSEWAADDESVDGDELRAVALADALVRVARLGTHPVEVSLLGDDLARRIDRLLHPQPYRTPRIPFLPAAAIAVAASLAVFVLHAQTLESAQDFFERLMH